MKKVLLAAAAFVLGATSLSAQSATPWFLSGNVALSSVKEGKADAVTSYVIQPQVGYMFNDNFGLALDLNYGFAKAGTDAMPNMEVTTFGAGLSGLYSLKITDKFFYTPSLRVGFNSLKGEQTGVADAKFTNIGVGLNFLGFEFRPSCRWGFTTNFGSVSYDNLKPEHGDSSSVITAGVLNNVGVGFKFYF